MKADITRRTFRHELHYAATIQQQGRVPLDADWNEQVEIQHHHDEVETTDVVGKSGFPIGDSFKVEVAPGGGDLRVMPGRGYVDGILCENDAGAVRVTIPAANQVVPTTWTIDGHTLRDDEWVQISTTANNARVYRITGMNPANLRLTLATGADNLMVLYPSGQPKISRVVTYQMQPELLAPPAPAMTGLYLVYLDVWRRHVTALEDRTLREVALGGPDTCTRMRTTWQVRLHRIGAVTDTVACEQANLPAAPARGALSARAFKPTDSQQPCVMPPTARYRSLENQLYRVEVHDGGVLGTATFKYSIDNGAVVTSWLDGGQQLTVASTGKDAVQRFSAGDWVELIDDAHELAGVPGTLAQVDSVVAPDTIVLATPVNPDEFPLNPRVRRWDQDSQTGTLVVEQPANNDGYVPLGDAGVEVRFEAGTYTTGDYWLVPARTITTDVEWPKSELGTPLAKPRLGIDHHYAKLAIVSWNGTQFTLVSDCRPQFPPLTDIHASHVKMDPGFCDFPPNVKTVQDAISQLCMQKENACCELVINPGDDVQWSIDHALELAAKRNIRGLHVCFAAGTHTVRSPILIKAPPAGGDVTVSGCGLAAHVVGDGTSIVLQLSGWDSASVSDLTIRATAMPATRFILSRGVQPAYGALTFLDCKSSVAERLEVRCAAGNQRRTNCIAASTTDLPSKSAVRIENCELSVGNKQAGIALINIDRPTVTGNRIANRLMITGEASSWFASKQYLAELRTAMLSEMRVGTAASQTVATGLDQARNHVAMDHIRLAFTSDRALEGAWSAYALAGGNARNRTLRNASGLAGAIAREQGKLPNHLVARTRQAMRKTATKVLNRVLAAGATAESVGAQYRPFHDWAQQQQQAYTAAMSLGVVVGGTHAGDVRILDNSISGALTGIRVAVSAGVLAPAGSVPMVSRARIAANTVTLALPASKLGNHSGIFVGSCASLVLENNFVRRTSGSSKSNGISAIGVLGAMMRAQGNHASSTTVGIRVKPTNVLVPEARVWMLSENVAVGTTTPIDAPESVKKVYNAP